MYAVFFHLRDGIEVLVTNLFTEDYGKIRGYSIIVCELNPWLDNNYYHSKLHSPLARYSQVIDSLLSYELFRFTDAFNVSNIFSMGDIGWLNSSDYEIVGRKGKNPAIYTNQLIIIFLSDFITDHNLSRRNILMILGTGQSKESNKL